jgi:hypothetical protein
VHGEVMPTKVEKSNLKTLWKNSQVAEMGKLLF